MNTKSKNAVKESKPKITAATLMRLAGMSAIVAGACAIVVGMSHPVNVPSSVTTPTWVIAHIAAVAMCFFGLFGMVGIYTRQAERSGWLGLAGFVLFSLWLALMLGFTFMEAFILPQLATESPKFVAGFLGMFTGVASEINLGVLPTVWLLTGPLLIFGGLLFGIATFRAGILSRWAGALLAVGAVSVLAGAALPPEHEAKVLVPMGLALAWLGYALFSERREKAADSLLDQRTVSPEMSKVA